MSLYFPETESKAQEWQEKEQAKKQQQQEADEDGDVFEDAQETLEPVRQEDKVSFLKKQQKQKTEKQFSQLTRFDFFDFFGFFLILF